MEFGLFVIERKLRARRAVSFERHGAANVIRGELGRELFLEWPEMYARLFAPPSGAPSGFKDPPRPYVVRTRDLEGRAFRPGEEIPFRLHLFDGGWPAGNRVVLDLAKREAAVARVKVEFLSPTKLRGEDGLEFGPLLARLRDRISSLRGLYGEGPLDLDFRGMGERARLVRTVRQQVIEVEQNRFSRSTGQRHSIGGFVGEAEYEGDLAEFVPFLDAGAWTGVGRHTAWGNGEIRTTILA